MKNLVNLLKDENGATAIEYGLIVAGLAVFIAIVIFTMGDSLANMFGALSSEMQENMPE